MEVLGRRSGVIVPRAKDGFRSWFRRQGGLWLVLVAIAAFVAYALAVFIVFLPAFSETIHEVCGENGWCGYPFRGLLIVSAFPPLILPVIWFNQVARRWDDERRQSANGGGEDPGRADRQSRFLFTLTTISIPYFILSLALLIELPVMLEGKIEGIAAVAGIMVLYALSLLGGFVFEQLSATKSGIEDTLVSASTWFDVQRKLSEPKAEHSPPPVYAARDLFEAWGQLYDGPPMVDGWPMEMDPKHRLIRGVCLSNLLRTYALEERKDIAGALEPRRRSPGVWPALLGNPEGRASFFATNVGYYARFLDSLVPDLGKAADGLYPSMAVVTYALPTHWWNWPTQNPKRDAIYEPIVQHREKQRAFAHAHGRIFRRVLVGEGAEKQTLVGRLFNSRNPDIRPLWADPAGSEDQLYFLSFDKTKTGPARSGGPALEVADLQGAVVESDYFELGQLKKLPSSLSHIRASRGEGDIYWMFKGGNACPCKGSPHGPGGCLKPVREVYTQAMHPYGWGKTEFFVTTDSFLDGPMATSGAGLGLGGCADIMFLGACSDDADIWSTEKPFWGCALLSTLGPNRETIFLTVVHHPDSVQTLWTAVRAAFQNPPEGQSPTPFAVWPGA